MTKFNRTALAFLFVGALIFTAQFASARTFYNIDQMTGWSHCDACSGKNASGPRTAYSMTRNVSSPSRDGKAARFWLGGSSPYASAIWWKQLGGNKAAKHFKYDLYFYIKNIGAAEALEFDTNQTMGGYRHIFGTECSLKTSHQWSIWNGKTNHWVPTGIACSYLAPYKWHHLVEEYVRVGVGQVKMISITLDGKKHYLNRTMPAHWLGGSGSDINVAVQLDGNGKMTDYSLWVDKVTLTYY